MIEKILKNLTLIKKNLLIYEIILRCYSDENRLKEVEFLNARLKELLADIESYENNKNNGNYEWLHNKIINDSYTFSDVFLTIKDYIDNRCRMLSVVTLKNMGYEELITFKDNFIEYTKSFKSIDDAATYTCYHSGLELSNFIEELISYAESSNTTDYKRYIPVEYLENNKNEIVIDLKKWVDIFNHLNYAMKSIKPKENQAYHCLLEHFNKLQMYYFIIITSPGYHS